MSWKDILKEDELDDDMIQHLLDEIRALEMTQKLFEEDPKYAGSKHLIPGIIEAIKSTKEQLS